MRDGTLEARYGKREAERRLRAQRSTNTMTTATSTSNETYSLIVMSFDGDYKVEETGFTKVQDAWECAANLGSKWFFYPFRFVVDESDTVVGTPDLMTHLEGSSLEDLATHFKEVSEQPEARGVDAEAFSFMV